MEESSNNVRPDIVSYLTELNTHANKGDVINARLLYDRMYCLSSSKHRRPEQLLRPTTALANKLIHAYARVSPNDSNASAEAQEILESMLRDDDNDDYFPPPNLVSFCSVVNAWAHSTVPDKVRRARVVLREEIRFRNRSEDDDDDRLLRNAHNMTLDACAFADPRRFAETLRTAVDVLESLSQSSNSSSVGPDATSYATFFRVYENVGDDVKDDVKDDVDLLASDAFRSCRERGLVDARVWKRFRRASSTELLRRTLIPVTGVRAVFGGEERRRRRRMGSSKSIEDDELISTTTTTATKSPYDYGVEDLPSEWRRNVKNEQ